MGFQQDWRKFFLLKFSSFFPDSSWKHVKVSAAWPHWLSVCLSVCLFAGSSEDNRLSWQAVENMAPGGCLFSGHLRTTPGLLSYLWIYPAVGLPSQSREQRSGKHHGTQETKCLLLKNTQRNTHTHTNSTLFVAVVSGTGFYQVSALMYQRWSLSYTITKLWTRDWKL